MRTILCHGYGSEQPLYSVQFKPWEEESVYSIASLVVHAATVIAALSDDELFAPFITILTNTVEAKVLEHCRKVVLGYI